MKTLRVNKVSVCLLTVYVWQESSAFVFLSELQTVANRCEEICRSRGRFDNGHVAQYFMENVPTASVVLVVDEDEQGIEVARNT